MGQPLHMAKLFPFQQVVRDDEAQFKLWRAGRRTGKSRGSLNMGTLGHGPIDPETKERKWKGLAQGKNVLWIGPDYKQLNTIWKEDIEPRFKNATGCSTNANEMTATLGESRLVLRSAENPNAIRGMGKNVGGVIIDEGAHLDMESLLTEVVMPILLDEGGWLMVPSTPNAAHDGYVDEGGSKRTPSYYNTLCLRQLQGLQRGWSQFHHTAQDNPKIKPAMFQQLVDLYPEGSLMLRQEVFGELLTGGTGFAFPEMDATVHQREEPLEKIEEWVGGCDWGYTAPGWIGVVGLGKHSAHLQHEFPYNGPVTKDQPRRRDPEEVGYDCGLEWLKALREGRMLKVPELLYCDSAMADVTHGMASIMDLMQSGFTRALGHLAPTLVAAPKGKGSRHARKAVLHALLRFKLSKIVVPLMVPDADGTMVESPLGDVKRVMIEPPRFTVHPRCTTFWATTSGLPLDPKDPEDVDTEANDHPYDGLTYCLLACFPELTNRQRRAVPDHRDRLSQRADRDYEAASESLRNAHRQRTGKHFG